MLLWRARRSALPAGAMVIALGNPPLRAHALGVVPRCVPHGPMLPLVVCDLATGFARNCAARLMAPNVASLGAAVATSVGLPSSPALGSMWPSMLAMSARAPCHEHSSGSSGVRAPTSPTFPQEAQGLGRSIAEQWGRLQRCAIHISLPSRATATELRKPYMCEYSSARSDASLLMTHLLL